MEEYNFQLVEKINQQVHVVQVPDTCSFWMIRTKSGAYYSEYIHNGYIAIGWNAVLQSNITQDTEEKLRQAVELNYADKRPGAAINKASTCTGNRRPEKTKTQSALLTWARKLARHTRHRCSF